MPTAPADQLGRTLLQTIVWLDLFAYPPTAAECWQWLVGPIDAAVSLSSIVASLDSLVSTGWLIHQCDRFSLVGHESNFTQHQQRQFFSQRKLKRANFFAAAASWLPFVRLVAVTSKLSYNNATDDSDIDLFVVTSPGTIWTSRLILAGCLQLLRLRPAPGRMRDSLCLSFLVDEHHLDLSRFALATAADPDLRWFAATLRPLYDASNLTNQYIDANISWVGEWLPQAFKNRATINSSKPQTSNFLKRTVIFLARQVEPLARHLQERWFPPTIRNLKNLDTRVVIESGVLKFHVTDRRADYQQKYQARLQELGLTEITKHYVVS